MNFYLLSLLVHITGLTLLGGTVLIGYMMERRFWKLYGPDRSKALVVHDLGAKLGPIAAIGGALLILSGILLVMQTKGAFAEQLWFRVKMMLVLVLIVMSAVTGRQRKKTSAVITADTTEKSTATLARLERNITVYYLVQLAVVLAIFVLGVFKFN
ncbi:hypothetical protein [Chitinophaga japonensis]|uniref:Uncharacterized protein n=1 Tax=Chitinophaga japonensis TaxID=104662 RepID=A0A562SNS8_CHIJA|nr:hypothetical protein [Chitinophaga japonensis]TWI82564.1 hypothetical protein LX66_5138 [Chitinophaga japonensis]